MADPNDAPRKKGVFRIVKFVLPLIVLFVGFFGVQIWMIWDEQNAVNPDKPITNNGGASNIKADLARIAGSTDAVSEKTPAEPSAENEQAITAGLPGLEYYRLQVGSFKDPHGAEKLSSKLKEMGYGSIIVISGDQSKVVTMSFFSREQADTIQSALASEGVAGFSDKTTVPAKMTLLHPDSILLQSFLDDTFIEIPEMLRELCDTYYVYEGKRFVSKTHESFVLKQISKLSDMKTIVENMQVGEKDQELQNRLKAYLTGYVHYLEKAKNAKAYDRKILWPGLLDAIESFGRLGQESG